MEKHRAANSLDCSGEPKLVTIFFFFRQNMHNIIPFIKMLFLHTWTKTKTHYFSLTSSHHLFTSIIRKSLSLSDLSTTH